MGGMNSTDRCRPGPRAPTQLPPSGWGHRLAGALGTAEPDSAEGEELLPTRSRSTRDEVANPTATMASPTTATYATSIPARRMGPRGRAARASSIARSTSGSTSFAISWRPSRRRSSRGMVALAGLLAQQRGQPAACLEHVHLGRGVRATKDLRHLGQRPVLVVMQGHRGTLLRWEVAQRFCQVGVRSGLLARSIETSEDGVQQAMPEHRSHGHADRNSANTCIRSIVRRNLVTVQVELYECIVRGILGRGMLVEIEV